MENTNPLYPVPDDVPVKGCDRRSFLANASKGILATGIIGSIGTLSSAEAQENNPRDWAAQTQLKLPPLDAPSEKKKPPVPTPMPPDKRIGYAIVGLGHLSLNQI